MNRKAAAKGGPRDGPQRARDKKKAARKPKLDKSFKQQKAARLIPLVVSRGEVYPESSTKVSGAALGGPDNIIWVNTDERDYQLVFDDPPGSPLENGKTTIDLPAATATLYGSAGPFRVKPGGSGTYKYTLTAVNWAPGPGGPDVTFE